MENLDSKVGPFKKSEHVEMTERVSVRSSCTKLLGKCLTLRKERACGNDGARISSGTRWLGSETEVQPRSRLSSNRTRTGDNCVGYSATDGSTSAPCEGRMYLLLPGRESGPHGFYSSVVVVLFLTTGVRY